MVLDRGAAVVWSLPPRCARRPMSVSRQELDLQERADHVEHAGRVGLVVGLDGDVADGVVLADADGADLADEAVRVGDGGGEVRELTRAVTKANPDDGVVAVFPHGGARVYPRRGITTIVNGITTVVSGV
jgi:hypothetical protein